MDCLKYHFSDEKYKWNANRDLKAAEPFTSRYEKDCNQIHPILRRQTVLYNKCNILKYFEYEDRLFSAVWVPPSLRVTLSRK